MSSALVSSSPRSVGSSGPSQSCRLKYTYTTTASVLNQLSPIFLLVLATVFLRERLTRRRVAAIAMRFAGAVVAVT